MSYRKSTAKTRWTEGVKDEEYESVFIHPQGDSVAWAGKLRSNYKLSICCPAYGVHFNARLSVFRPKVALGTAYRRQNEASRRSQIQSLNLVFALFVPGRCYAGDPA